MCGAADVEAARTTRIVLLETETPDISATDIRRRASRGESLNGFVPDAVAAYIEQHRLYSGPGA
jgi:nicotinate-nucleotide adenylyltransferase